MADRTGEAPAKDGNRSASGAYLVFCRKSGNYFGDTWLDHSASWIDCNSYHQGQLEPNGKLDLRVFAVPMVLPAASIVPAIITV